MTLLIVFPYITLIIGLINPCDVPDIKKWVIIIVSILLIIYLKPISLLIKITKKTNDQMK